MAFSFSSFEPFTLDFTVSIRPSSLRASASGLPSDVPVRSR
jgi:hypothetical protein